MKPIPGTPPAKLGELVRSEDRLTFLYLERCTVHRDGNALTATDDRGVIHVPAATIGAVMFGPGTRVTHQAMVVLADSGSTSVWVGEQGVRYYAHGRGLSNSSRLIEAQARLVSNQSSRLKVAREMYAMRFPGEDVSALTMQQLRGREGARVRQSYRDHADRTGVEWNRRDFNPNDFDASDAVNQALSAATTCLYGVAHGVIVALGCSPALGFVHSGHARSFVYDVADLYKAEFAIPVAFDVAAMAEELDDIGSEVRHRMRDEFYGGKMLTRCARDVRTLLLGPSGTAEEEEPADWDVIHLWDGGDRLVAGGRDYAMDVDW